MMHKEIIGKKILDYLDYQKWHYKKSGSIVITKCPICKKEPDSASIMSTLNTVHCIPCDETLTICDLVRIFEPDYDDKPDDEIYAYLKNLFKLDVYVEAAEKKQTEILNFYSKNNFSLVPIARNSKNPIEKDWTNKEHRSIEEWKSWIDSGLNIGVRTGAVSDLTVVDIDTKDIPSEIKSVMGNTLMQLTKKGVHLFYKYEKDLVKTRIKDLMIDIETDGGQVVIAPSVVEDCPRNIVEGVITKMPESLKAYLINKINEQRRINVSDNQNSETTVKKENEVPITNFAAIGEGEGRNDFLIRMGGIVRSQCNFVETKKMITLLNKTLCNPPISEMELENTVIKSIERYTQTDEIRLADDVLKYLKQAKVARKDEIEIRVLGNRAKGEDKERIDKALIYLITTDKIVKCKSEYHIIEEMDWSDDLINYMKPLTQYKIPYFHDFVHFCFGDLIIVGGQNKTGKTVLAMNIIQRFVKQGVKPYYIYNESGSRFIKTCLKLGLKDGDFYKVRCADPEKIILKPNSFVVYDWVKPTEFARTDNLFNSLVDKLEKTNSIMICFVQLRNNDEFFARDQIGQFPALLTKYVYDDQTGENTKFQLISVRDSKFKGKTFEIPCKYNWDSKEVKLVSEIEEGK